VLAVVVGPFIAAIVYGIKHRESGTPRDEETLEAQSMLRVMKDENDIRTWGGSR
jgi:hypothetical protein